MTLPPAAEALLAPYQPRFAEPLGIWHAGPLRLKPTTIRAPGTEPATPALLDQARSLIAQALPPAAQAEGQSHDLGFAILHQGTLGTWLLGHWWAHGDILCQRLFRADPGTAAFEPADHRPLMACVWELAVIDHERRAWTRTMLTDRPDPQAYLADRLPAGPV